MNPFVFAIKFTVSPQDKDSFIEILTDLFTTLCAEPTLVNAVLHQGMQNAHEILVYETWNESVEDFLRVQMQRDYRVPLEEALIRWEITREVGIYYPFASWQPR